MRYLIPLLFIFYNCSTNKNCQNKRDFDYKDYYLGIAKADSLLFIGQSKEAYTIYSNLFKKYDSQNGFTTNEYFNFLKSKVECNKNISKKDLEIAFSKHGIKKDVILSNSILKNFYNKYNLEDNYEDFRKMYLSKIDLNMRKQMIEMIKQDQRYRGYEDNDGEMNKTDKANESVLKELFLKGIYPDELVVGNYSIDDDFFGISILLLHTKDSIRKSFFLPKMKEFIKKGKCKPLDYAVLVDQLYLYSGEDQVYGTYSGENLKKEDFVKYNQNRRELDIGLPSIEYDIWRIERYK